MTDDVKEGCERHECVVCKTVFHYFKVYAFSDTETEEPEATTSTSAGLSMPSLDPEEDDAPVPGAAGPSGATQADSVEGDTRSGEAV